MKHLYLSQSVKTRILTSILGALFLFVVGYTWLWSDRYTNLLEISFEDEMALAPHFLSAPLADALWNFQPEVATHSLKGLEALKFSEFARVIVRGESTAEFMNGDTWMGRWDDQLAQVDYTAMDPQSFTFGSDVLIVEPLGTEEGELLGHLVVGFSRADITASIRAAYIQATIIGIIIFAIFAMIALFIATSITRPLNNVIGLIDRVRQGDTDFEAKVATRGDEFGNLGRAVEEFRDNMAENQRLEREEADAKREQEALEKKLAVEALARAEEVEREKAKRVQQEQTEAARKAEADAAQTAERETHAAQQHTVVTALAEGLGALSGGDLGYRIETTFPHGYEKLRTDFNDAMAALQGSILTISASGAEINRNTAEISAAAADLAKRTETTAAALEETASALDGITGSVRQSAEGAQRANGVVREIRGKSEASSTVVAQAIQNMAGIKESSDKIAKVIEVIDGVAFQTNLLALNAGVEAARAGEAGRGFAVVASEVRELSQRTAEAAREVGDLIRVSSEQVDQGVQSVGETGDALENILGSILEISEFVGEIASSAEAQSNSITEINTAITQLDTATQQNAAMFEETTAASQSLNGEATALTEAIAHFRTGEGAAQAEILTWKESVG